MPSPFDFLNSINMTKKNLLEDDPYAISGYTPFVINKALSYFVDTVMFANEINIRSGLSKEMQYRFYLEAISKDKRFYKWPKKQPLQEDLELIKREYCISEKKAIDYLKILPEEQLIKLRTKYDKGGIRNER